MTHFFSDENNIWETKISNLFEISWQLFQTCNLNLSTISSDNSQDEREQDLEQSK